MKPLLQIIALASCFNLIRGNYAFIKPMNFRK